MQTDITIYRGQYEHIEGSVPEFLDSHPWGLICNVSTITTRPLKHTDEETQIRVQCLSSLFQIYSFPTYLCAFGSVQHSQQLCEE